MSDPLEGLKAKTIILGRSEHTVDPEWPYLTMCGKRIVKKPPCKICASASRKRRSHKDTKA